MANLSNINNKFLVTTGGNVGIGVTSPVAKLQVAGTTTYNSDTSQALRVCDAADVSKGIHIGFDTTQNAGIIQAGDFGVSYRDLSLNPNAGNVGIGTTGPLTKLDIRGSTFVSGYLAGFDTTPQGNYAYRLTNDGANSFTNLLGGNLGIGIDSPATKLNIRSGVSDDGILLEKSDGTDIARLFYDGTSTNARLDMFSGGSATIQLKANGITHFSGGNVGIGTTTPNRPLTIQSNSGATAISIYARAANDYGFIQFFANNQTTLWSEIAGRPSNLSFYQNSTEVLRLGVASSYFPSGNVGIGQTGPGQKLVIGNYGSAADGTMRITALGGQPTAGTIRNSLELSLSSEFSVNSGDAYKFSLGLNSAVGNQGSYNSDFVIRRTTRLGVTDNVDFMIDGTSGNVGIGTTSPQGKLDSVAPAADLTDFGRATGSALNIRIANVNGHLGQINFCNDAAPAFGYGSIGIVMTSGSGVGLGDMVFGTKSSGSAVVSTERMRITSGGNVLIGTTGLVSGYDAHAICRDSPSGYALIVKNSNTTTTNNTVMQLNRAETTATTGGYALIYRQGDASTGTSRWIVYANGDNVNTNNSYGALSDERLKENITDATPKLDDLMKVKVRNFNLKGEETKQIGVVAQELEEVFPGIINENKLPDSEDETLYKSVKYSVFVPILIKAIQELKAEIELLKSK